MPATTDPPVLLSTREAAAHLGVSVETIRRLARHGHLRAHRLYGRGRWRYRLDDHDALLDPDGRRAAA